MVDARRREDWQHTAWLTAMIANVNRDPKKKPSPFTPEDFNPMAAKGGKRTGAVVVTNENVGELKVLFENMGRSQVQ